MVLKTFCVGLIAGLLLASGAPHGSARAGRQTIAPDSATSQLTSIPTGTDPGVLLQGGAAWRDIPSHDIHLNRTPPLYEGDPLDDGWRPTARVSLARAGQFVLVRLVWTDSTESRPTDPERVPDEGSAHIYKKHSLDIQRFADAACVMIPKATGPQAVYPAIMMGEKDAPVDLYYWHLVKGFQKLEAAGRSTTTRTGETFPGSARYTGQGWEVIFELPAFPPQTPLCFAVWDGNRGQRDGLKYFSTWYEVAS